MGKKGKNATNASKGGGNSDLKDLEQKTKLQARRLPYSKVDDATWSHLPRYLQAVVFADSFTQQFRPITLETPKVQNDRGSSGFRH